MHLPSSPVTTVHQNVNSEISSYLEPYTIIQPENAKYQIMTRLIKLDNANFPEQEYTLEEKVGVTCSLYRA